MAAPMACKFRFMSRSLFAVERCVTDHVRIQCECRHYIPSSRLKSTHVPVKNSEYCVNLVKKCDNESYLCALLYPQQFRSSAFALRAWNVELSQIQDVTSDKMRAVMRMQFWKDTVNKIFQDTPPQTPVAMELHKAIHIHKLSRIWFTRLLEARGKLIDVNAYRTLADTEEFGENTVSSLAYLLLECAGVRNLAADHAISHLGRCQALVTLLRAVPFHAARGRVYIPVELLIQHNVSEEDIRRAKVEQGIKDVMFHIASTANSHLEEARHLKKDVPKEAFPVFLNSVICAHYLRQLQLADFNVFDPKLQVKNALLPWQLWKQKLKKTY